MTASGVPLAEDALLGAITDAMVAMHERYYGRSPRTAKTRRMGDDLLACTLGGVYTDVEKTLIELERAPVVRQNREAFQAAMAPRVVEAVERLSGRRVVNYITDHHVGPDLAIELFFLSD